MIFWPRQILPGPLLFKDILLEPLSFIIIIIIMDYVLSKAIQNQNPSNSKTLHYLKIIVKGDFLAKTNLL